MNHGRTAAVPGSGASVDVPGDVKLVAVGGDCGAAGAFCTYSGLGIGDDPGAAVVLQQPDRSQRLLVIEQVVRIVWHLMNERRHVDGTRAGRQHRLDRLER